LSKANKPAVWWIAALPRQPLYRKPDRQTAEAFLATGRFSWNSGMFIWLGLSSRNCTHAEIIIPLKNKGQWLPTPPPKTSIDYALMKTQLAYVLPVDWMDD